MNRPPSILVDTGFEVDQNGALTEIVIPSVVTALNAPRKITFEGQTLSYIPSTAAALQEFEAPNATAITTSFSNYTALTTLKLASLETHAGSLVIGCNNLTTLYLPKLKSLTSVSIQGKVFDSCSALANLDFPSLESLSVTANAGYIFSNLAAVSSIDFPMLKNISDTGSSNMFYNMGSLTSVEFPVIETINGRIFPGVTSLQTVT